MQWTGPSPDQNSSNWQTITYKYDVTGRRSEKKVDGYTTRYCYDGSHVIAEYDGNNNLLRKYIYGPGVDEPICMIEVADSNAAYYYHYDALGSVVALSDSSGDTVQTYEYSVYGQVAAEDPNHTNPYMFTGRRFDIEIGLYYYRARYYDPFTGRFLQTDPIGYGDGMNMYAYGGNNPLDCTDPSGTMPIQIRWPTIPHMDWISRTIAEHIMRGLMPRIPPPSWWGPTWTVKHFLWHYWFGGGEDVYLNDIGLLGKYQAGFQPQVDAYVSETIEMINNSIAFMREWNSKHPDMKIDRRPAPQRVQMKEHDFEHTEGMFVIGDSDLYLHTEGWVYADGSYEVTIYCLGVDSFKDPYDLRGWVPDWMVTFEAPLASPYSILANWRIIITPSGTTVVDTIENDE